MGSRSLFRGVLIRAACAVIDPPAEEEFVVGEDELVFADDAIIRAASARSLRLAGFGASSSAMSAPSGTTPRSKRSTGRSERSRLETVIEKKDRAAAELKNRRDRAAFIAAKRRYFGREIEFDLPAAILVGKRVVRTARVRYGVAKRILGRTFWAPFGRNAELTSRHQLSGC